MNINNKINKSYTINYLNKAVNKTNNINKNKIFKSFINKNNINLKVLIRNYNLKDKYINSYNEKFEYLKENITNEKIFKFYFLNEINLQLKFLGTSINIISNRINKSWKSYNIFGSSDNKGILQLFLLELLKNQNNRININLFGVYNEKFYDILTQNKKLVKIFKNDKPIGLKSYNIMNLKDIKIITLLIKNISKSFSLICYINITYKNVFHKINLYDLNNLNDINNIKFNKNFIYEYKNLLNLIIDSNKNQKIFKLLNIMNTKNSKNFIINSLNDNKIPNKIKTQLKISKIHKINNSYDQNKCYKTIDNSIKLNLENALNTFSKLKNNKKIKNENLSNWENHLKNSLKILRISKVNNFLSKSNNKINLNKILKIIN